MRIALCDAARAAPDAVTLDAIAHLALTARRSGCHLMVERATDELLDLADALGFAEVLLT